MSGEDMGHRKEPRCYPGSHVFVRDDHGHPMTQCVCGAVAVREPAGRCEHGFGPDHPCVGCTLLLGVYSWRGLREGYGRG